MPTGAPFRGLVTILDVVQPAQSVGAHLAAKLQSFASDERTLTDELCDMLCIWLSATAATPSGHPTFWLELEKTTAPVEVITGADLELVVSSPLGFKRCLLQAKVLDPATGKLRCASKQGWEDLRVQLSKARASARDLAFLLVYVPGTLLNGKDYGYSTYEQEFLKTARGRLEAFMGATVIAVDDLLAPNDQWIDPVKKVRELTPGQFHAGIPFWRFLLELMLCLRSTWQFDTRVSVPDNAQPFRSLSIGAKEVSRETWDEIQAMGTEWLRSHGAEG